MWRVAEARAGVGDVMPESAAPSSSAGAFVRVDSAGVVAEAAVLPSALPS